MGQFDIVLPRHVHGDRQNEFQRAVQAPAYMLKSLISTVDQHIRGVKAQIRACRIL